MPRPNAGSVLPNRSLFRDFEAMDTDGDGKLSIEEIDIYVRINRR